MKTAAIVCLAFLFVLSSACLSASDTACKYGTAPVSGGSFAPPPAVCAGSLPVATPTDLAATKADLESDFSQKLTGSTQQLNDTLNKGLSDAEARLKANLTDAVNKLPQRLLSDEAKKEIADSLRTEMKADIEELRKDLQRQIDDLKQGSSSKPRTK